MGWMCWLWACPRALLYKKPAMYIRRYFGYMLDMLYSIPSVYEFDILPQNITLLSVLYSV